MTHIKTKELSICLIAQSDGGGGAAIAAFRQLELLLSRGFNARMLVQKRKQINHPQIASTTNTTFKKALNLYRFGAERLAISPWLKKREDRFAFSIANTGEEISQHPWIKESDVLHLHWTNFGFLSLKSLESICKLNKKIVWTMHDMWPFTGGCHYNRTCEKYKSTCSPCPYLKGDAALTKALYHQQNKLRVIDRSKILFTAPSIWLQQEASLSSILQNRRIETLDNPLDTQRFRPLNKERAKKELNLDCRSRYLLFGAPNIRDQRKGFDLLMKALPEIKNREHVKLLIFGKNKEKQKMQYPMPKIEFEYIDNEETLAKLYNAAELTIVPSRQETFGQTVSESLACGTPVVAFNTSGQAELIEHLKTGYLAQPFSTSDLAKGIDTLLNTTNNPQTIAQQFNKRIAPEIIADKMEMIYASLFNESIK